MIKLPMMIRAQPDQVRRIINNQVRCSIRKRTNINDMADIDMLIVTTDDAEARSVSKIYLTSRSADIVSSVSCTRLGACTGNWSAVLAKLTASRYGGPAGETGTFRLSASYVGSLVV